MLSGGVVAAVVAWRQRGKVVVLAERARLLRQQLTLKKYEFKETIIFNQFLLNFYYIFTLITQLELIC